MIRIDLTGLFSFIGRLFKRKKNKEVTEVYEVSSEQHINSAAWPETLTVSDIKDMCESIGAFEAFRVEDPSVIAKVCEDISNLYNSNEKNEANLKLSFVQGFSNNGMQVDGELARMFVDNFLESYFYSE